MGNVLMGLSDGCGGLPLVFAGVFASAAAGFSRQGVERWILSVSRLLAEERRAHERARRHLLDALLGDVRYLELARFRAMLACVALSVSSLLHFCAPMVLALQPAEFVRSSVVWSAFAPCLAAFSMLMAYSAARRVELMNAAAAELRLRRRLPKLP